MYGVSLGKAPPAVLGRLQTLSPGKWAEEAGGRCGPAAGPVAWPGVAHAGCAEGPGAPGAGGARLRKERRRRGRVPGTPRGAVLAAGGAVAGPRRARLGSGSQASAPPAVSRVRAREQCLPCHVPVCQHPRAQRPGKPPRGSGSADRADGEEDGRIRGPVKRERCRKEGDASPRDTTGCWQGCVSTSCHDRSQRLGGSNNTRVVPQCWGLEIPGQCLQSPGPSRASGPALSGLFQLLGAPDTLWLPWLTSSLPPSAHGRPPPGSGSGSGSGSVLLPLHSGVTTLPQRDLILIRLHLQRPYSQGRSRA